MNYEEYTTRMKALKRRPIEREHYEEIVEKAYMALLDVDKDEFCALSDKVIGAVRRLADAKEYAKNAVNAADKRAEDFRRIAEKSEDGVTTTYAYDAWGMRTGRKTVGKDGKTVSEEVRTYDKHGRLSEIKADGKTEDEIVDIIMMYLK